MERDQVQHDDVIELGVASVETKGRPGGPGEFGVIALPLGINPE